METIYYILITFILIYSLYIMYKYNKDKKSYKIIKDTETGKYGLMSPNIIAYGEVEEKFTFKIYYFKIKLNKDLNELKKSLSLFIKWLDKDKWNKKFVLIMVALMVVLIFGLMSFNEIIELIRLIFT